MGGPNFGISLYFQVPLVRAMTWLCQANLLDLQMPQDLSTYLSVLVPRLVSCVTHPPFLVQLGAWLDMSAIRDILITYKQRVIAEIETNRP